MRVYYLHKICALRNNSSLLRMLRDVGDSPALGLAGCRLFATGETGTTPGRLHRQQLSGLRLVTAPLILSLSGCRISSEPWKLNRAHGQPYGLSSQRWLCGLARVADSYCWECDTESIGLFSLFFIINCAIDLFFIWIERPAVYTNVDSLAIPLPIIYWAHTHTPWKLISI